MDIIQVVLMGIVQGLSEFLPISSSAHLVFTSNIYKIITNTEIVQNVNMEVFVDIMLHLGTLIAVLVYYRKTIFNIIKALFVGLKTKDYSSKDFRLGLYIILGTFLTVIVAAILYPIAEKLVFLPWIVGVILFITGLILLYSEQISKKIADKKKLSRRTAIIMGLAQGLAVLPGFSRSGITIASGLISGIERKDAADYSFLLSIPIIVGASAIYPAIEIDFSEVLTYNWTAIIAGTITSGVVGYFCIKYFLKFVSKFSLSFFGYYCLATGLFSAIFFAII